MAQPLDYAPRPRRQPFAINTAIAALTIVAFVGLLMTLTLSRAIRPRDEPITVRCSSNLRQIYSAMVLYSDENHGAAALDFATLLASEDLVPEVFTCYATADTRSTAATQSTQLTADLTPGSGHCSYVYGRSVASTRFRPTRCWRTSRPRTTPVWTGRMCCSETGTWSASTSSSSTR